ncbi:MAG: dihydroorotate dehydrogenase (quinone), partial [Cryomorphaceae bacterium]|nr:dihydroorotate dehydrogenase (quinone) [Cryomorphaceae bacterium]MBT7683580.1 dihydroorotate dehydrogenase (quinone) [Cryomorphaceae bacterium]
PLLENLINYNNNKPSKKPMLLKISPDLEKNELDDIISLVSELKIDGIIATNTTISRDMVKSKLGNETGGLSGQLLNEKSNDIIKYLRKNLDNNFPIIGVGGVMTKEDAIKKLNAGADLIQLYTGFIYKGPELIKDINKAIISQSN